MNIRVFFNYKFFCLLISVLFYTGCLYHSCQASAKPLLTLRHGIMRRNPLATTTSGTSNTHQPLSSISNDRLPRVLPNTHDEHIDSKIENNDSPDQNFDINSVNTDGTETIAGTNEMKPTNTFDDSNSNNINNYYLNPESRIHPSRRNYYSSSNENLPPTPPPTPSPYHRSNLNIDPDVGDGVMLSDYEGNANFGENSETTMSVDNQGHRVNTMINELLEDLAHRTRSNVETELPEHRAYHKYTWGGRRLERRRR